MRNNLRNIFLLNSLLFMQMWFPITLNKEAEHVIKENTCRKLFHNTPSCHSVKELSSETSSAKDSSIPSINILAALSALTIAVAACFFNSKTQVSYQKFIPKNFIVGNLSIQYKIRQISNLNIFSLKKYFHTIYFHIFKSYLRCNLSY